MQLDKTGFYDAIKNSKKESAKLLYQESRVRTLWEYLTDSSFYAFVEAPALLLSNAGVSQSLENWAERHDESVSALLEY